MQDIALPEPGAGEARVRVAFAGVNFIDVYHRTGLYPLGLPFTPGTEAAGIVDAVGPEEGPGAGGHVEGISPGARVAYVMQPGAYAEFAVVPVARLVPVPPEVDLSMAAAVLLQGMTAHYLVNDTFPLRGSHVALVHAAAGGVGLLLVQLAKARGARVIGTVSTAEKERVARDAGADEIVRYTEESFAEAARRVTGGHGVDVVYDSVGRSTFEASLASLRPRGYLVLFGQSSGPVPAFDPAVLAKGSLFLTRPGLGHYTADRAELLRRAEDLFHMLGERRLHVRVDRTLPLERAADAHRLLESRETAGKVLLEVSGHA